MNDIQTATEPRGSSLCSETGLAGVHSALPNTFVLPGHRTSSSPPGSRLESRRCACFAADGGPPGSRRQIPVDDLGDDSGLEVDSKTHRSPRRSQRQSQRLPPAGDGHPNPVRRRIHHLGQVQASTVDRSAGGGSHGWQRWMGTPFVLQGARSFGRYASGTGRVKYGGKVGSYFRLF